MVNNEDKGTFYSRVAEKLNAAVSAQSVSLILSFVITCVERRQVSMAARDSNPDASRHKILSLACLPISPGGPRSQ